MTFRSLAEISQPIMERAMNTAVKKELETVKKSMPTADIIDPVLSMIERAARDPQVDIDKMERLVAMQERSIARASEQAFNDAMAKAQSEMRPVAADASNPQTHSKYASYAALDKVMRPLYTKHGFALSFGTDDGGPSDFVRVTCHVSNSGYTRKYQVDMPADGKGAKGGDVMTKTHAVGSAMSYGQRYLLKMIFNISVGDDDGNAASDTDERIMNDQIAVLNKMIDEIGGKRANDLRAGTLKYFKVDSFADIRVKDFNRVVTAIEKKRVAS